MDGVPGRYRSSCRLPDRQGQTPPFGIDADDTHGDAVADLHHVGGSADTIRGQLADVDETLKKNDLLEGGRLIPALTYFPEGLRPKYLRRWRA